MHISRRPLPALPQAAAPAWERSASRMVKATSSMKARAAASARQPPRPRCPLAAIVARCSAEKRSPATDGPPGNRTNPGSQRPTPAGRASRRAASRFQRAGHPVNRLQPNCSASFRLPSPPNRRTKSWPTDREAIVTRSPTSPSPPGSSRRPVSPSIGPPVDRPPCMPPALEGPSGSSIERPARRTETIGVRPRHCLHGSAA